MKQRLVGWFLLDIVTFFHSLYYFTFTGSCHATAWVATSSRTSKSSIFPNFSCVHQELPHYSVGGDLLLDFQALDFWFSSRSQVFPTIFFMSHIFTHCIHRELPHNSVGGDLLPDFEVIDFPKFSLCSPGAATLQHGWRPSPGLPSPRPLVYN